MSGNLIPCPIVPWCVGHTEWDMERLRRTEVAPGDDVIHAGEPELALEVPANRADIVVERQLLVREDHEFYFMYGNISLVVEVDGLEDLAAEFDRAAMRLRDLARSAEGSDDDRRNQE